MGPAAKELEADEARALDHLNGWLATQRLRLLSRLCDLYHDSDDQWLMTYPELDCFAPRNDRARYLGVSPASGGSTPIWPDFGGKKVLAYVKPFRTLEVLLEQLRRLKASSLVVCPGIADELAKACEDSRVRIVREPLDLPRAAAECDIAIGNATHGFTATVLAAGKPQLLLPLVLEQRLTADRVRELGCGVVASTREPKEVILGLRRIWEQPKFALAAQSTAARLAPSKSDTDCALAQAIESLMTNNVEVAT
jgi:UDP:flavonoid glycosyltransferase YjiC (YdhE family)